MSSTAAAPGRKTAASRRWSEGDVARLIELWTTDLTNAQIAKKLEREESAVAVKASRINLPRRLRMKEGMPSKSRVRQCLRCTGPFFSSGAGNRFCDPCKNTSEWRDGGDYYGSGGH